MLLHSSLTFLLFAVVYICNSDFLLGIVKDLLKSCFKKDSSAQSNIDAKDSTNLLSSFYKDCSVEFVKYIVTIVITVYTAK